MSAPSIDVHPRVNQQPIDTVQQSADPSQATLQAFQSILAQQLREQKEQLQEQTRQQLREQREQLREELEEKLETKLREQDQRNQSACCVIF